MPAHHCSPVPCASKLRGLLFIDLSSLLRFSFSALSSFLSVQRLNSNRCIAKHCTFASVHTLDIWNTSAGHNAIVTSHPKKEKQSLFGDSFQSRNKFRVYQTTEMPAGCISCLKTFVHSSCKLSYVTTAETLLVTFLSCAIV